ncbi:MAG: glutamine-hydrolyzing GMP synthase [Gammaproteobacteria bacterium]
MKRRPILILDFGSQYTPLIARRLRELGVYCILHPYNAPEALIQQLNPCGIILSGGPESVREQQSPRAPESIFKLGCPILGICYGMQTMAEQLRGNVTAGSHREFGYAKVTVKNDSALLEGLGHNLDVWMSHGDHVDKLPEGFICIASTPTTPLTGMADEKRRWYGLQFHPEVVDTPQGMQILKRFVHDNCNAESIFEGEKLHHSLIQEIQDKVQQDTVVLGLSGGVDSSVVAMLLHKAIGKQLICLFVDTGLLRQQDEYAVIELIGQQLGINIITIDASEKFLSALSRVTDPEEKRHIIGRLFVEVFDEQSKKINQATWLAQGTIASDVIESASSSHQSHMIKSHHNVAGLPEGMTLKILEPLRTLFKDEVIKLGQELGLSEQILRRHPFPGPGLAIRILGEIKREYISILQKADAIFMDELHRQGWYARVSQAFTVFLPVKSVGVMGDARQYAYVIALRAVESTDFMTARWAHLPYELLETVSTRIINEVHGVSRVVYDISGKPPATIEWE